MAKSFCFTVLLLTCVFTSPGIGLWLKVLLLHFQVLFNSLTFKIRPATSNLIKVNTPNYSIPSKVLFSWLTSLNCPNNFTCAYMIISLGSLPSKCRKYSPKRNYINDSPDTIISLGHKIDDQILHTYFVQVSPLSP